MKVKEDTQTDNATIKSHLAQTEELSIDDFSVLSNAEIEVLKAMRSERYLNIEIRFKNRKPFLCVTKEEAKFQIEARLSHIFHSRGNEKIEITTSQGSINHSLRITRFLL